MNKAAKTEASAPRFSGKIIFKLSTADFVVSVICFVLSRAKLLTYMNPFGMAAYTALFTNTGWFYAMVCTGAGIIISKGDYTALRYLLALGLATPILGIWDKHRSPFFRGAVMSLSYFGVSLCLLLTEGFLLYDFIYFSFEAFVCFVSVYLIDDIVPLIHQYKSRKSLSPGELTAIASVAAMIVLSCWSIPPLFGINIASLIAVFIILAVNLEGNCALGAAVGVIMGLAVSMGSYESVSIVGAYTFGSFVSGLFKKYSRLGVLLGFTLANAVVTAFLNDTGTVLINPIEVLTAGVVFVTLPPKTLAVFTDFSKKAIGISAPRQDFDTTSCLGQAVYAECGVLADALGNLADIYALDSRQKRPGKRYINSLFNKCADNVCSGCGLRFGCWQSTVHNNYQYMLEMLEYAINNGGIDIAHLPKKFAERCVKKEDFVRVFNLVYNIYQADRMWLDKTCRLHGLMSGQLAAASKSARQLQHSARLKVDCEASEELIFALDKDGYPADSVYVAQGDEGANNVFVQYKEAPPPQHIKATSDIVTSVLGTPFTFRREVSDDKGKCLIQYTPAKKYTVRSSAIQMHKNGEYICGDCYAEIYSPKGNYIAVISDGMGSGREAYTQAQAAVAMLVNLVDTGAGITNAAELINSSLLIRSHKDCFATLDIIFADLDTGKLTISKTGAAPTYIKTPAGVQKLECNTLPAGILADARSQCYIRQAEEDCMIVMISDGISNTAIRNITEPDWLYSYLADTDAKNPDAVANHILNCAVTRCGGKCSDDMTVIVAYIDNSE